MSKASAIDVNVKFISRLRTVIIVMKNTASAAIRRRVERRRVNTVDTASDRRYAIRKLCATNKNPYSRTSTIVSS